ncbi:MAG: sigma-70 family RNA polymerase sigma factor [Actinomycetota bacterium]|nr:sigma-70 family RNA polymerase sigma factor [Actinomycetota bacterium]
MFTVATELPVLWASACVADRSPLTASATDATDAELLQRLMAGDESAWREAVRRYRRLVELAVRRVVSCPSDIDEAMQRSWLALWRNASAVREAGRLPGWLSVTARREALAIVRRRREVLVGDLGRFDTGYFPDASVLVEHAERARYLRQAVDRLPDKQRRLMRELLADRSSYDELSVSLSIPRGSIGPMRARALRTLRQLLPALEPEPA